MCCVVLCCVVLCCVVLCCVLSCNSSLPLPLTHSLTHITSQVIATNTAIALLYQSGYLSLSTPIASPSLLGPAFAAPNNTKAPLTILNLLLHNSGFPPDPVPWYWDPAFGCPQSANPQPKLDYSCRAQIYDSIFSQPLQLPIGQTYVYSDLNFITLAYVVGRVATR